MPVDSRTKVKNVVVAAALLSFVGLVYYTAISKMSKTVSQASMMYYLIVIAATHARY